MIEVKLEDVLFTHALTKVLEENFKESGKSGIHTAANAVMKVAQDMLNAEDKRDALLEAYALVDEFQEQMDADSKRKISCRKGCAFCCHIEVQITDLEKDLILDYVQEHGIKYNAKRLEQQLPYTDMTLPDTEFSRCVFLGSDNACNIYPVRPMACRKYLVHNDPKLCNAKKYPHGDTIVYFHYKTEILASGLITAAKKSGSMAEVMLDKVWKNGYTKPLTTHSLR